MGLLVGRWRVPLPAPKDRPAAVSAQGNCQGEPERTAISFSLLLLCARALPQVGWAGPLSLAGLAQERCRIFWGTIELSKIALQPRADFASPLWTAGVPLLLSTGWSWARNLVLSFTPFFKTILRLRTIHQEICKINLVLSLDLRASSLQVLTLSAPYLRAAIC